MMYKAEEIEAIASKLREMLPVEQEKQQRSKQEAIKMLSKEITDLKNTVTRWITCRKHCAAKVSTSPRQRSRATCSGPRRRR